MKIEKASTEHLAALAELEAKCFPDEPYPRFFFTQAREIFGDTLLVATEDDKLIGYLLAAPDAGTAGDWWILSMAVEPDFRNSGIGKKLLSEAITALERLGGKTVYLSVSEKNKIALDLYKSCQFLVTRRREDYFGPNEDRLILKRAISDDSPFSLCPDQLLSEAGTSVSFSSVLFAVSAAILAMITSRDDVDEFIVPIVLIALAMFAAFYSVLFYANASGGLARIHDHLHATKPLRYGNSVSEYLGVYPLVAAFPLLVYAVTESTLITISVAIVNYLGFLFYQLSGFDLLSRIIIRTTTHIVATVLVLLIMAVMLVSAINKQEFMLLASLGVFLVVLVILTVSGIRQTEKPSV